MLIIIDNYDSFTYNLYQSVAQHRDDIEVYRNDAITVEELLQKDPEGIIISPGPCWPDDAGITKEVVRKFASKVPILGVCLGFQAIVEVFGGKITLAEEIVHGKPCKVFHRRQGIFKKMSLPFDAGRYHSLIAKREDLPDVLLLEAETSDGKVMAVKHREYACYGVQFHPESILTPEGDLLLKEFLNLCTKPVLV
ncbi:MAG: anthranilate synthase/aminodeoxychorismate synthase-like glutamine amidotransferase [Chlamydiales bacterium]|jgi:anthranilate synthase/aminodeoxychorismate synthase-like glutamine amidotransferase